MKRFLTLLLLGSLFMLTAPVRAQGIESGTSMVSFYGGLAFGLEKSGIELEGKNLSWGNAGGELGLSYLFFPTPYFGLGADLRYAGFQGSEKTEYRAGYWYWHTLESDFETHTLQLMASGRINLNPGATVRLYIPFGAGAVFSRGLMEYTWDDYSYDTETASNTSLGWYAGVGVEFDSTDRFAWGLEARYNAFRYDDTDLAHDIGGAVINDNQNRSYVSVALKVSFK